MAESDRMITLEIDGQTVTITVEREQSQDLAAQGFLAERTVYVTTWNDLQIDNTLTTACRVHDVAVEINCRPERQDPPDHLLRLAIETGCLFSIDSDAHAPGQLDWLDSGCARAEDLGIGPDQVINTRTADDLLVR